MNKYIALLGWMTLGMAAVAMAGCKGGGGGHGLILAGHSTARTSFPATIYPEKGMRIDVSQSPNYNYSVFTEPKFGAAGSSLSLHHSEPMVDVEMGWGYFVGKHPIGCTKSVCAWGLGTKMIVEFDTAANVTRVYLVPNAAGDKIDIYAPPPASSTTKPTLTMSVPNTYVEVDQYWHVKGPLDTNADTARKAFVKYVTDHATASGLP